MCKKERVPERERGFLQQKTLKIDLQHFGYLDSVFLWLFNIQISLCFVSGHGMIVEGHPDLEHWGRRLMASEPDNETEAKNCSEPGKQTKDIQITFCIIYDSKWECCSVFLFVSCIIWFHFQQQVSVFRRENTNKSSSWRTELVLGLVLASEHSRVAAEVTVFPLGICGQD